MPCFPKGGGTVFLGLRTSQPALGFPFCTQAVLIVPSAHTLSRKSTQVPWTFTWSSCQHFSPLVFPEYLPRPFKLRSPKLDTALLFSYLETSFSSKRLQTLAPLAGGWHSCAQEKGVHFLDSLPSSPHACLQCREVQAVLPPPFWGGTERGLHVLKIRALSHLLSNSDGYFQSYDHSSFVSVMGVMIRSM